MVSAVVHRPARATGHLADRPRRTVEAPPTLPDGKTGGGAQALLPVAGVLSSLVMMTVLRGSAFVAVGAVLLVVTGLGSVALLLSQRGQANRQRRRQRERYLDYLEELREALAADESRARRGAHVLNPPAAALADLVRDPGRLWERRPGDPDFLRLRVGRGSVPAPRLALDDRGTALAPTDPFMLAEARAVVRRFESAADMPVAVPLDGAASVSVVGDRQGVLAVARSLLAQLAALHAPDDVAVAAAFGPDRLADWEWLKWLPHVGGDAMDPAGGRWLTADPDRLAPTLAGETRRRASRLAERERGAPIGDTGRLVVLHDTYGGNAVRPGPDGLGLTYVHLVADRVHEPPTVDVRVTVAGGAIHVDDLRDGTSATGRLDEVDVGTMAGLARRLAPVRLSPETAGAGGGPAGRSGDLADLLGLADHPGPLWSSRDEREFLRVPIGVDDAGQPVLLDLKESAQLGMGPHGLCVGATGSGKSELLRTLVLALAATHSPEDLSLVLVDFKGGAAFAPFAGLPHLAGMITNLEDDVALIDRAHASLAGEVRRRQRQLKEAGDVASIAEYAALRREKPDLAPMPHLLLVIDEFGELLTARPELIELLLSIGRIGRSIGVHLLLSSQRIEGGRLRGLDTYLSYRLGLRTFSEEESRTVLDRPDAFHLPAVPGYGYLKVDTTVYQRFKASYVSGPTRDARAAVEGVDASVLPFPVYPLGERLGAVAEPPPADPDDAGPSLLAGLTARLRPAGEAVPLVWLPPLPSAVTLDAVGGPVETHPDRGLRLAGFDPAAWGPLRVPLGQLDDPARQWQGVWPLDLTTAGGHLAVIGGPQSGKTTLLRTLATALALTHTPSQVALYGLDLSGAGLRALDGLPHCGGIATRTDAERLRRTVEEVRAMLHHRQEVFRDRGLDSVDALRARHAAGEIPEITAPDVVLLVDGFGGLREDFEELSDQVTELLQQGGGYGIHVVAAMLRWNDVRLATQAAFGTRIELRQNDPADSIINRKLAETIRADRPGRALTADELFAQVALPRVDGVPSDVDLGAHIGGLAAQAARAWTGPTAPPVRVLPATLPAADLPGTADEPTRVPVGLDETALAPVNLDLFGRDQHLLVFGDTESGKSNLLRGIAAGLIERHRADDIVFVVFDPRRGLRGLVPEAYLGGYATNTTLAGNLANSVAAELARRATVDGPDGYHRGLGPRVVALVDDYDLLASGGQPALGPFVPLLPAAPELGLHVVLTRRVAGAGRALYDPLLTTLLDNGTTGLVLDGNRSEGELLPGVYPARQPVGRGIWVRRGAAGVTVQTALAP